MNRERVKTIILSILIGMSILLTNQIWRYSTLGFIRSEATNKVDSKAIQELRKDLIMPKRIVVGFGRGLPIKNSTVLGFSDMEEAWETSKKVLLPYFAYDNVEVIPIDIKRYNDNYGLRHIELEFGDNISSVLVSSIFATIDSKIERNIREIKRILLPAINRGSIFIIGKDSKAFEIRILDFEENRDIFYYVSRLERQPVTLYYPLLADENNYTIMPLNMNNPIPQVFIQSRVDIDNAKEIGKKSEAFFENLDFVKTIRETSGALVYLYGFGQRSLRISSSGRVVYSEDVGNNNSTNVNNALDVAIEFIKRHGGLPDNTYLARVEVIDNGGNQGYHFAFNHFIEEYPIVLASNRVEFPLEIEVFGNRIRSFRSFIRDKMNLPVIENTEAIISPIKLIERNISMFIEDYANKNDLIDYDSEEVKKEIIRSISSVNLVYFDTLESKKMQILNPAWAIHISGSIYYFDAYDGRLLNLIVQN